MNETVQRTVKGYVLHERVGAGGFGEVYRAFQPSVGREVAVKVILPQHANHPDFIRRFEVEAQTVARLEHPHIVPLYDYWRDPEGAYLVMRWLPQTLRGTLKGGALPPSQVAQLLEQVCAALTVAHRENVIHRDLKPDNILLDEDRNAYVADFGIAINLNARAPYKEGSAFYGSPEYVSPEQIRGQALTPRSDIYSLGFVLYELLTGEKPFPDAKTPSDYVQKHLTEPVPAISSRHPAIPAALDEVLSTATAKDPAARYASAGRLAAAFRAALPAALPRITGQPLADPLTQRELDILRLVVEGLSNAKIAERLFLSASTVKWYMKQVYAKLDVHSRSQAIDRAERLGLFAPRSAVPDVEADQPTSRVSSMLLVQAGEPVNPYKGLRAFQESDAHDFFGRAALVEQLLNRLSEADDARFLAVVGPSGSGKSSVVNGGLIPALRRGALASSPRPFIAQMFPGAHPFDELEAALLRVSTSPLEQLRQQLHEDRRGLARVVKRLLPADPGTELVLVIDQFEELFTLVEAEDARVRFIENLLSAITDPRGRVRVIVTLRADFYDRPLLYPGLAELVRTHTELVLPMTARELEQAIVGPAERVGVQFEGGLVATIINEVGEQPGALPLLQYALTELFERREGVVLASAAYKAGGGVTGALARRADELYVNLSEEGKAAARQLFLRLVTLGEGTEDTRRRVLLAEVNALDGDGVMDEVINAFAEYRLLTVDRDPLTRSPTVEIAHEALIREWGMLGEWLDASRDEVRLQRRLAHAAAEWHAARDPSFLASGARLAQFEALASQSSVLLTPDERAFIDISAAEHERAMSVERERQARELQLARQSAHRLRLLVTVLAVAVVGALLLSGVAITSANKASTEAKLRATQQAIAEANFNRAEQQRLYLAANEAMDDGAGGHVGMALALRSLAYGYSPEADAMLLRASSEGMIQRQLTGHQFELYTVAYSPDGSVIAASTEGGTRIWDAATGEERLVIPEEVVIRMTVFSPDGRTLVTVGWSNPVVHMWDTETGEEVRAFVHRNDVQMVYFSPDGAQLIVATDEVFQVWDAATGQRLTQYPTTNENGAALMGLVFPTPERTQFILSDSETGIYLQDADSGETRCTLHEADASPFTMFWWSERLPYAVIATEERVAYAWDIETCTKLAQFEGHDTRVFVADYDPTGDFVITGDESGTAIQWDFRTGREIGRYVTGTTIRSLDISPDGSKLIMPDFQIVNMYDLNFPREPRPVVTGVYDQTYFPRFAPDGESLYVGGFGGYARWSLTEASAVPMITFDLPIRTMDVSPDGSHIIVSVERAGTRDFKAYLLNANTGEIVREFDGHSDLLNFVEFSADGTRFASADFDTTARTWDVATGQQLQVFRGHEGLTSSAILSHDGELLVTSSTDATVRIWNANTGEEIHVLDVGVPLPYADFSPDGRLVASADSNGLLLLWDVATGAKVQTLSGHTAPLWNVKFSPDGTRIVTSSWDGTARIWDVATGETIRMLEPATGTDLYWAEFSADGEYVVTGAELTDRVYIWRVDLDDVIAAFCAHQPLELSPEERAQYGIPDDAPMCPETASVPAA